MKMLIKPVDEILANFNEQPSWVFESLIPARAITLLTGKTKEGKSTLAFHFAHALGEGRGFAKFACQSGTRKTLWVSAEGGWEYEIADRRVKGWEKWLHALSPDDASRLTVQANSSDWRNNWDELGEAINNDGGFGLIVVDHLMGFTTASGKSVNDDGTSGPLLSALNAVAARTGCAVLLLHHRSEKKGSRNTSLGSSTIPSHARSVMTLSDRKANGSQTCTVKANRNAGRVVLEIIQTPTKIKVTKSERVMTPITSAGVVSDSRVRRRQGQTSQPAKMTREGRQKAVAAALQNYSGENTGRAKAEFVRNAGVQASLSTIRSDITSLKL